MSATQTQVGGSHYKDMKIQPVEYIHANGLGFIEGSVIKYVSRHKTKGGKQDLDKAIHFLQMLIEREYPEQQYRMLTACEFVMEGDEVSVDERGDWKPCLSFGFSMSQSMVGTVRRPIAKGSK